MRCGTFVVVGVIVLFSFFVKRTAVLRLTPEGREGGGVGEGCGAGVGVDFSGVCGVVVVAWGISFVFLASPPSSRRDEPTSDSDSLRLLFARNRPRPRPGRPGRPAVDFVVFN